MILDNSLVLSDQQAITATAASTNVWDTLAQGTPYGWLSAYGRDLGEGEEEIPLLVQVIAAFNNLTSLTVSWETSVDAAFTSPVTLATTAAIPLASLVAGYRIPMTRVPRGSFLQFNRLKYTVTGTAPTTGTVTAAIVAALQSNTH